VSARGDAPSKQRRLYLDTSAYLCVLLGESGGERITAATEGAELLSSVLLVLEAKRNLVRLARSGLLTAAQFQICSDRLEEDTERFVLRDLTLEICQSSLLPAVLTPQSLDLVHLRTALWFHASDPIDRFVTTETVQQQVARELGLPI
jgi:hypothetical protein